MEAGTADSMLILSMISFSLYPVFATVGSAMNHVRFLAISLMFKEKKIFAQACFYSSALLLDIFSSSLHWTVPLHMLSLERWQMAGASFMFPCQP